MTNKQKLRKYIREMVIKKLYEDAPYGKPDETLYLFKTGQDYLQAKQNNYSFNEAKKSNTKEPSVKQKSAEEEEKRKKKSAYQIFFNQALAKFGYSGVSSIPDEKKKEFFDYIDSGWNSKEEKNKMELNELNKLIRIEIKKFKKLLENKNNKPINAGTYVMVQPTPIALQSSYPATKWLKNKMKVKLIDDAPNHNTLDVLYVELPDGSQETIYDFNIMNAIDETSATGGIAGYETPRAFTGKKGISKKQKSIANQLGYELVDKSYTKKDEGNVLDLNEGKPVTEKEKYIYNNLQQIFQSHSHDISPDGTYEGHGEWGIIESEYDSLANDILGFLFKNVIKENKLNENSNSFYFKDENLTSEQKLGLAMRHVRNNLYEVEKIVQRAIKMKNEETIDNNKVGKRTYQSLKRINEKVIRLMVALQELK